MMFPPTISVYVIYLVICIEVCRASYDEFVTRGIPWQFWGMTRDEYHNALDKAQEYKDLRNAPGRPVASSTGLENRGTTWSGSSTQGVFLTGPQYQRLIDDYKAETPDARRDAHKRYRRKSVVFGDYYLKWKIPISFALHENFTATQRMVIRAATQHIETVTAVRFKEVEYLKQEGPILSISHYKKNPDICSSCIGMCGSDGGGILLGDNCANEMGSIVHELGHTLGLYHEHSRPDRDEYITMHPENIIANLTLGIEDENFRKFSEEEMDLFSDVPFDLGSIMIYQTYALSKSPATAPCFEANDKRYTGVIGQRVALSFFDAMAVNKIYGEECIGGRECVHGGYPDPRSCDVCLCPEGLGGEDCSGPDPQSRGCSVESSTITVISAEEKCIMSRDYDVSGFYNRDDTCSYLFKVAAGCDGRIKIRFDTEKFHVYCNTYGVDSQCYHWVEVKHEADLSLRGIRYCCDEIRDDMVSVTSEGRHMLVTFDARYSVPGNHYVSTDQRKGFKFCYSLESSENECNTTNETSETERPLSSPASSPSGFSISSTPSSSPSSNPPSLKSSNPLTSIHPSTSGSSSPVYYYITNVCLIILYLIVMNS